MTGGSSHIPRIKELITAAFGKAPLPEADPDRLAARGAAALARSFVTYEENNIHFCPENIPLSLGIRAVDNSMRPLIKRPSVYPISQSAV
jgi:molecular chaperone DnaK (HSP70)